MQKRPKPKWLKTPIPTGERLFWLKQQLEKRGLSTICQSARCPNIGECWQAGHATFLIMGERCTRNCGFCSVLHEAPRELNPLEAQQIAEMVEILKLKYAVITSVTRDDLPDGGADHFATVITHLKEQIPDLLIEVLIPDFDGRHDCLDKILHAKPDVLGHNIETVSRLYPHVNRLQSHFSRSISVLNHISSRGGLCKTGLMVGLGEEPKELEALFLQLASQGVQLLTIGQYLQPVHGKVSVSRYYTPDEFIKLETIALACGIKGVAAGPFVRSSYHAEFLYRTVTASSPKSTRKQEGYSCAI